MFLYFEKRHDVRFIDVSSLASGLLFDEKEKLGDLLLKCSPDTDHHVMIEASCLLEQLLKLQIQSLSSISSDISQNQALEKLVFMWAQDIWSQASNHCQSPDSARVFCH